jgi:uncharacterized protein (TIGR00251 family)
VSALDALQLAGRGGAEPAVRFTVRVQPRSSRAGVDGVHDGALRVRVHAPPVEGAANDAVVEVLAKALGVAKRAVAIVSGAKSRSKVVEVSGLSAAEVRRRFSRPAPSVR